MNCSILLAGFGGQGIVSAGRFIASAALTEGKEVCWFPSYGPEMRGGTANCGVIVSDKTIGSPFITEADALVAMNSPSLEKFSEIVKPGGLIIIDSTLARPIHTRTDVQWISIPASELAAEQGNIAYAIIILLGCLIRQTGLVGRESFSRALFENLPLRHHHLIPAEMAAFDQGVNYAVGRD